MTFPGAGVPRVRVIAEVTVPPAASVTAAGLNTEVKPREGTVNRLTVPVKPVRAWTVTVDASRAPQL